MQNKGALTLLAILLAVACAFQLSFTFVTRSVQNDAVQMAGTDHEKERNYLDSMKSQVVYNLGFVKYTYSECLEKEINLGLDLRGGMNVTLEIALPDVLKALSGNSTDPLFNQALEQAKKDQANSTDDYLTLFAKAYAKIAPQGKLASIFATVNMSDKIKPSFTNEQVMEQLRKECASAIDNSYNVLSNRIDRFGVVQPNIQRLENSGRILVELPGVKDPERVSKLLQGTANLEFWPTYTAEEAMPFLAEADRLSAAMVNGLDTVTVSATDSLTVVDSTATGVADTTSVVAALTGTTVDTTKTRQGGLFSMLMAAPYAEGPVVGYARTYDVARINQILESPQVKENMPSDLKLMWNFKHEKNDPTLIALYAIRGNGANGPAPLDGSYITEATGNYSQNSSRAEVDMAMNAAGAKKWSQLTGENKGKSIAIVLDNFVYSAPNVQTQIDGGRSQITGDFTIAEARDLANVLKSGKLPAPATIIQEAIVGPTLGQESINSGMSSFIIAFLLVLVYMFFFYNHAGLVANIALVANLFFLFGVLVSFGAVLTLPGIAGIVLTMGMAVDANVIIYERVKEELRSGKGIAMSIKDGYKNAYSAIIDGNATTLITGIVLFIFGTGPVQGFATTLIIGILTSLFCAIFISRLIFEALLTKNRKIRFSHSFTERFLSNTKINFVGMRRYTYIVSAVLFLAVLVSLVTRGLNYGVDFTGGRTYVVRFDQSVTDDKVRAALKAAFPATANTRENTFEVKQFGPIDQFQKRITTQYRYQDDSQDVTREVNQMLFKALAPLYKTQLTYEEFTTTATTMNGIISSEKVGASIAHDIVVNSFIAVFFSLLMIGLYIALRFKNWQYGMGGVVSLLHDAVITVGVFSLLYSIMPFNLTVDQSFIAAILTIIGYSINDTVIIFDRIREYNFLYPRRTIKENMNNAINSTLARTVNTAGTTIVVLLAIFLFGGEVIQGFIFALLFGVVIGTFSSVFVATPVAYDLLKMKHKKIGGDI